MLVAKFELYLEKKLVGYEKHVYDEDRMQIVILHAEVEMKECMLVTGTWFDIQDRYITHHVYHDEKKLVFYKQNGVDEK